jgi:hypothetical protein
MSSFEYLARTNDYLREPFLMASGEKVPFDGRYFSMPAYAAQLDKRLFTAQASHPVTNLFKLYVNRTSNRTISIEPTLTASGYEGGTPHYADYILDARDTLSTVFSLHAADSDHTANDFKRAHLTIRHAPYNLDSSSASGRNNDYIHQESATLTPSGSELCARGFYDVDVDEVQWTPFTRPKSIAKLSNGLPYEPCFPMVIKNDGSLPSFSALDDELFGKLGLGASASGGLIITGDVLKSGTSIKLIEGSGASFSSEGQHLSNVPWKQYPCGTGLNRYYTTTTPGATVSVLGRQSIYDVPNPPESEAVLMLNVSDIGTSGIVVQNWPGNYSSTDGVNASGQAHDGIHVTNKLLYSGSTTPSGMMLGRSIINGKIVFGHHIGGESFTINPYGTSVTRNASNASPRYNNRNSVYMFAGAITPPYNAIVAAGYRISAPTMWAEADEKLSPLTWSQVDNIALQPTTIIWSPTFPPGTYNTYTLSDIIHNYQDGGACTYFRYTPFGISDYLTCPDNPKSGRAQWQDVAIPYTYKSFLRLPRASLNDPEVWVPDPLFPDGEGVYRFSYIDDRFITNLWWWLGGGISVGGKPNLGLTNSNGTAGIQYSNPSSQVNLYNRVAFLGEPEYELRPPQTEITIFYTYSIFGGLGGLRKQVLTYTGQERVPVRRFFGAEDKLITFSPSLPSFQVYQFGSITWDPDEGVNYLYFNTYRGSAFSPIADKYYFAKMDTDFEIFHVNVVSAQDFILGRALLLDI